MMKLHNKRQKKIRPRGNSGSQFIDVKTYTSVV